jgi:hypothetical protein
MGRQLRRKGLTQDLTFFDSLRVLAHAIPSEWKDHCRLLGIVSRFPASCQGADGVSY